MIGKSNMTFNFSQTYLYKMHKLTSSLDTTFDRHLRQYADIGLSQFTLLLSVQQHQPIAQRSVATFLGISPGAVSRQVEIAQKQGWITIANDIGDRRRQHLSLTNAGADKIQSGIAVLEKHVFHIFDNENVQSSLMGHIDMLQKSIDQNAK
jgi:DNA-binding MarR family transcriptional regulator